MRRTRFSLSQPAIATFFRSGYWHTVVGQSLRGQLPRFHSPRQVWLLLMLKNGRAACVGGTLIAALVAYLSYADVLPGWCLGPF